MTTAAGLTAYTYDADNRLATVAAPSVGTISLGYDAAGNPTARTLPNGISITAGYDSLNRLTSVTETAGSNTLASYNYTLGPAGNRTKVTEADGTTVNWSYDADYHLTGETLTAPNGTVEAQASYGYDGVGNRTSMSSGGATTTYTYNSLDQLTSASSPSSTASYTYDGRGNLTAVAATGTGGTETTSYSYNAANALTGATLPTGTSSTYTYDAAGRQVSQTTGGVTTNYLWDEQSSYGDIVLETDGSGTVQASYTLGGTDLLAQTRAGTVSYVLPDGQGSVRQLANSTGTITDTYRYDAYGNVMSHTGTTVLPYGYDGQRLDATSGLYQLRSRSYDPTTGRFTSPDTASLSPTDVMQLDRYVYAAANPINNGDPSGHDLTEEAGIFGSIARIAGFVGQMGADLGLGVLRLAILVTAFCIAYQDVCAGLINAARKTIQAYQLLLQALNSLSLGTGGGPGGGGGGTSLTGMALILAAARTGGNYIRDGWAYFVHGTTTALWGSSTQVQAGGVGDFGQGFYTYADTRWGEESAWDWATRKAAGDGSQPILVRVKMPEGEYLALDADYVFPADLNTAYQLWYPNHLTGYELVAGPVGVNDANGQRVPRYDLPDQFKFEGAGVDKLQFDSILSGPVL